MRLAEAGVGMPMNSMPRNAVELLAVVTIVLKEEAAPVSMRVRIEKLLGALWVPLELVAKMMLLPAPSEATVNWRI